MGLFLFNPEQMLIGKLKKGMYKPFHINDKIIIEKNLKNLLGLKLLYSDYVDDDGKVIADTIAIDNNGVLYLIGYKKSINDNFLKRYKEQYENLMENRFIFEERAKVVARRDNLSLYRCRAIFISSVFTPKEIEESNNFPIPCELYTWSLIENILIFDKVNKEKQKP